MPSFKIAPRFDFGRGFARISQNLRSFLVTLSDAFDETTGHAHGATGEGKPIVGGGLEAGLVTFNDVQVTNAQLLALLGTDVTLVPAPGADLLVVVDSIYLFFDSAGAYIIGTAVLAIGYGGDNDDIQALTEVGFIDQATDQARVYVPAQSDADLLAEVNQPVVLRATIADLTGGNAANTVSIKVNYHVVDVVAFT